MLREAGEIVEERSRSTVAELSLVIPTFNERDNIAPLLKKIESALTGIAWEVIFVDDDSSDQTYNIVADLARDDNRIRLLHRIGRRGLSSAVVEGILSTTSPYVAVMDADMQHDERLLVKMFEALKTDKADLVVGSRYVEGGGVSDWEKKRQTTSKVATVLSRAILKADLHDPMSGFFMIRRNVFNQSVKNLSAEGYKILLDIIASAPNKIRTLELPYTFRTRQHGESKLDTLVILEYLVLILDKLTEGRIPARFILFAGVGAAGLLVHMAALTTILKGLEAPFIYAQSASTGIAMTFNFFLNNFLTYRDQRLKGFWNQIRGLLSFYLICSVGAVSNVGVAQFLYDEKYAWWAAGIAGIAVGAVWNYSVSAIYTWNKK